MTPLLRSRSSSRGRRSRVSRPFGTAGRTAFAFPAPDPRGPEVVFPRRSSWSASPILRFQAQRLDPHRTSRLALLQRRDVIADLGLFDGQRARLAASLERAQQECDQEIRNLVSAGLPSRQDSSIRKQPVGPSLDAQAYVARRLYNQQMYDAVNRELTDGQLQRLDELDLRYRGPLALVDEKVAVRIGLTPEQAVEVAPAYLSYLEHLRDFRRGLNWLCAQAVITRGAGRAPVPMEMIEAAYDSAALRLRQRIGAALLAALMPSKGQRWQALLGAPFVFRIAD